MAHGAQYRLPAACAAPPRHALRLRAEVVLKEPAHEEKNVRTFFRHGSSRSHGRGLLILEVPPRRRRQPPVRDRRASGPTPREPSSSGPVPCPKHWPRSSSMSSTPSHSNLKVKLTLTSINDDTTSLATSIRAGDPPDVDGLNDIDMPTFTRNGSFLNLTKDDRRAAVRERAQPRSRGPGHLQRPGVRGPVLGRPLRALVQQEPVRAGRPESGRPADQLRADPVRRAEDQQAGATASTASRSPATARAASASPSSRASGPPHSYLTTGAIGSQTATITGNTRLDAGA